MSNMFQQILSAQKRLRGIAHHTPVMQSRTLNSLVNAQVELKCENFQRVGAFKFRGAFNAISQLSEQHKAQGVIAYSSGNHAQAVALVGQLLNIKTTIVMPNNAPSIKRQATLEYGAEIIEYDPEHEQREHIAATLQAQHGYTLIPPYNHLDIIAGQGTAALELIQQTGELDYLLAPVGGGGLLSGSAIAAKGSCKNCTVIGIEPELADDATRSFRSKKLHTINNPNTIADGVRTPSLGDLTFPLVLEYVDDMQTVTEAEIMAAVKFLFYRLKLVVEPAGALGLAALLSHKVPVKGRVGIILSGGNIDGHTLNHILTHSNDL